MKADKQTYRDVFKAFLEEDRFGSWPFSAKLLKTRDLRDTTFDTPGLITDAYVAPDKKVQLTWTGGAPLSSADKEQRYEISGDDRDYDVPENAPIVVKIAATGSPLHFMSFEGTPEETIPFGAGKKQLTRPFILKNGRDYYTMTPNALGPPPELQSWQTLPPDSPRICCGFARIALKGTTKAWVTHDQYWSRSSASYSLIPREQKKILVETVSGVQDSTTSQDTIEKSLNVGMSGGWGPIAASINAALSASSSFSHTVVINSQQTSVAEDVVVNANSFPVKVIYWMLTDVYTLIGDGMVVATIETRQAPPVLQIDPSNATFETPAPAR